MKRCAYCGIDLVKDIRSKEHVIPGGLIGLFPEQNITFTSNKAYRDNNGQSISDVCKKCNNETLSELDTYGIELIKNNFMKKFKPNDVLDVSFDFNMMSRWLLKMAFNYERVEKSSCTWFKENIDYINGECNAIGRYSIFAGLHVDMNPLGEENDLYLPLSIGENLKFYDTGILSYNELIDGEIERSNRAALNFNSIYKSYSFRFASARFILVLWKRSAIPNDIENTEKLIEVLFPYKNINKDEVTLKRANDSVIGKFSNLIIGNVGMSIMDELQRNMIPDLEATQKYFRDHKVFRDKSFNKEIEERIISDYNKDR